MPNNLTPEETTALTNEDAEEIGDDEHPKGSLDEDMEGSGVDEPELDAAEWDDELEPDDHADFSAEKIKFEELTDEDREIYLEMVSLRDEANEGSLEKEGKADVKDLLKRCKNIKAELVDGSRPKFFDWIIKELRKLK